MKQEDKLCQNFTQETDFSFSILQFSDFLKLYTCNKVGSSKNSYSKLLIAIAVHVTEFKKNLKMFVFLRSHCTSHVCFVLQCTAVVLSPLLVSWCKN